MAQHLEYLYPMDKFRKLEPKLKQWFNIDRNTPIISKCLSVSFTPNQLMQIQSQIPDDYRGENGYYDIARYTYDYSDVLAMPIRKDVNADELFELFNNYGIEEDSILYDTLFFLFLYNESLNGNFDSAIEDAEYEFLQYAVGVRPEMLKLYILLHETSESETIKVRSGNNKSVAVDTEVPWLRDAIKEYLDKYLGVESVKEAKRELLTNYTNSTGAPINKTITQYIWGIYSLLEDTEFIKSNTKGKVSRKQAKFMEDYLMAIHLIDIGSDIDANNIRSRLNYLLDSYDSIEQLAQELHYKSSPNNNEIKLF